MIFTCEQSKCPCNPRGLPQFTGDNRNNIGICILPDILASQDADDYKSNIKDSIVEWQRKLRDRNISDWMIVQVLSQDSLRGNKPKIPLPRSAVFDKLRSDFGGKSNDRYLL